MKNILIIIGVVAVLGGCGLFVTMPSGSEDSDYEVTFDVSGGDMGAPSSMKAGDGEVITLPSYTGFKGIEGFRCWNDGITTYYAGDRYYVTGDVTFTAIWIECIYPIEYHLDGGVNPDGTPDHYDNRYATTLPIPEREGFVFNGWYTESEYENCIESIPAGTAESLMLYASWAASEVGTRMILEYSGTQSVIAQNMIWGTQSEPVVTEQSGALSFDYLFYDPIKGYYISRTDSPDGSTPVTNAYWSGDSDTMEWVASEEPVTIETKHHGIKSCMVWTGTKEGCTETQYIGIEDGVLYRDVLEQEYMTYGNMFTSYLYTINRTYDLFDVEEVDLNGYYSIDAYEDKGVSIEGDENMKPGDDVVLKAICEDGIEFDGWYNANGRFISSSSTLNLGRLVEDIEIHARGTAQFDTTFMVKSDGSSKHKLECNEKLTNVSWTLKHDDATVSGNSLYIDLNSIGVYSIIYSGTSQSGSTVLGEYNIVAGGDYSFSWTNDEVYYTVTLDIDPQDYIDCKTDPIQRYIGKGDGEHLTDFVTYESKYIKDLALQFETICEGMTDLERMNVVLSYTQNIPYMYDADSTGIEEYWKFALETILENNGDCEDTSILFCAIAKAMGYDTALMTLFADGRSNMDGEINHCVSLIKVDGCDGKDDFDGYCFCETTATGSSIGDVPWKSVTRTTIYAI